MRKYRTGYVGLNFDDAKEQLGRQIETEATAKSVTGNTPIIVHLWRLSLINSPYRQHHAT
jgi:hypothetical protein